MSGQTEKETTKTFDAREHAIIDALNKEPDGIQFNELANSVENKMSRNTLQKKIVNLKDEGVIEQIPPDEEWRQGQAKIYQLAGGTPLPGDIIEEWDKFRDIAIGRWNSALAAYDAEKEWGQDELAELYEEYTDLREGDRMFEITENDGIEEVYRHIVTELYRYHSERIFGATYIDLVGREDELGERMRNWVMLRTYERANQFRDASFVLWDESEVPGPESADDASE